MKSDKELNQIEVDALIDKLLHTDTPFICPHGRDVIIKIEKSKSIKYSEEREQNDGFNHYRRSYGNRNRIWRANKAL